MPSKTMTMEELLAEHQVAGMSASDVVEGSVIAVDKHEIWLDLGERGTGLVIGREIERSGDISVGDTISASVIEPESDEGYALLSLKKVAKEKGWEALQERFDAGEVFALQPFDANKGGLLVEVDGIRGFLPVSQLSAENYPRVSGADKDEILHRLTNLVGKPLNVRILDLNRRDNKLIVSEKAAKREDTESKVAQLKVGQVVKGIATGVVDFGIFVNVDGIEGLVHISELSDEHVEDPTKLLKVGEKKTFRIITIDPEAHKLSLSLKAPRTAKPAVKKPAKAEKAEKE